MTAVNIVITDGYTLNPGDNPWDAVAALGHLTVYERLAVEEVAVNCREADILVVNKTQIRETAKNWARPFSRPALLPPWITKST